MLFLPFSFLVAIAHWQFHLVPEEWCSRWLYHSTGKCQWSIGWILYLPVRGMEPCPVLLQTVLLLFVRIGWARARVESIDDMFSERVSVF